MEYRKLGRTDISVSAICLGTMTWGSQNTEAEAHEQIDYALDQGVNFLDTAEMYPVTPNTRETRGRTEEYIGTWIARNGKRDQIVLASKVSGPSRYEPLRGGNNHLDRRNIEIAIDDSLAKLKTDYLDLYQLHWPDRTVPMFGGRGLNRLNDADDTTPIEETLDVLADLVKAGKIRAFGVSNETPWGVAEFLRLSREKAQPRVASIQNAYHLLNRQFEVGLSEFALREDVGLLAYSPLASGYLTGKYLGGIIPKGSRMDVASQFTRYETPHRDEAVARYVGIAHAFGLDPAAMAIAFVTAQPFVTSNIIGATSMAQLKVALGTADLVLEKDVRDAIEQAYRTWPDPCP
ncbi:aldo/keto reductase [Novosphingobium sp. KCTC 2891]|uniref:aldo/keto reductase n=1 Tax=Novosphingobium sp. KCTC 2891 TaxID=2989730 RepID=UPI002222EEF1|nr:aldo/keto reductase [Novosphingobium sp. KCTC 2891]MCW1383400.1 aldo/keto reductase [Novosphingobium sp. KCTC 2891]